MRHSSVLCHNVDGLVWNPVAGIVITLINIAGGIAIAVFQMNMSMADAARNYALLAIGDGLATQIPAFIMVIAAGILVSKSGLENTTSEDLP